MRLRNSTCPAASAPCRWNTCFAMSKPIVVACSMDASFGGSLTPSPWHTDAVGGRPLHHPGTDAFASCLQKESLARRYWAAPPPPYWGWGSWWGGGWGPYWP